ncbi:Serine/threonine protein kinase [Nonomuraea maritima]|uniref:Serine/threonine protein kinase n=1 Tax=Nonomuraea maritima TaxID=683260 RepID=A0A1G8THC9_9ACTN|nr:serine/threonine-protein kinase [Nonomuraea maritima]SDJ40315.1 Serine/threonine protein kinase [Nonomuraea maritima]
MSELRVDDPQALGAYRLTRRLGQGGQGIVYLGESPQGAQVAVKLLHASLSGDADVRRRFLREVEAVRRVAAFCTAQLLDADLDGDRPYLVSEYVEGPSLRQHVLTAGPRRGGSLDRLAIGTATALGAIHRAGVVHRDFKPGNVLLGLDGPRVIDFGVSRLMDSTASTGHLKMGTPAYMAPERIRNEPSGPATDLWAWGLTMVFTATGRNAYAGGTYQEVLARVLYGKPDLGTLTGRLREIVDACLAPAPADRPDAEGVLRLLLGQDRIGSDVLTSGVMAAVGAPAPSVPPAEDSAVRADPDATAPFDVGFDTGFDTGVDTGSSAGSPEPDAADESGGHEATNAGRSGEAEDPDATVAVSPQAAEVLKDEPPVVTDPDPTTSFPAVTGRERPLNVPPARSPQTGASLRRTARSTAVVVVVVVLAGILLLLREAHGAVPHGWKRGAAEQSSVVPDRGPHLVVSKVTRPGEEQVTYPGTPFAAG